MLFTSPDFLFAFLPAFLVVYFLAPGAWRNAVLLIASLLFYFVTSGALTLILVLSIVTNHLLAANIARLAGKARKACLLAGIVLNVAPLLYFKYAFYFANLLSNGLGLAGLHIARLAVAPVLPIGISFFTFQAISYIADVYTGRVRPARSLVDFGMYHACFPQVIAGPIVRFEDVQAQVRHRPPRLDDFYNGTVQFCFGLAKKAILADPIGIVADRAFALPGAGPSFGSAWLGVLAYTLQIYLDFSGYSDMAIGLGRMLGFAYPENFNQPYRSRSITEFWRRWHITLSRWFRDYVYIPLGGNRQGLPRTLLNLLAVFLLCGLWHGAADTFVVWGLFHGALLVAERLLARLVRWRLPSPLAWLYSTLAVMVGWVFFRAESLPKAFHWLHVMARPAWPTLDPLLGSVLTNDKILYLLLGIMVSLVPYEPFFQFTGKRYTFGTAASCCSLALACVSIIMLSVGSFTPFIYFRF